MIKVEGHSNLFRDPTTGAIINTDDGDILHISRQFSKTSPPYF